MNQSLSNSDVIFTQADQKTKALIRDIADSADDRKAADITILKVAEVSYLADFFILLTGFSRTQARAISDSIEERLEEKWNRKPIRIEGRTDASWILMDYGEVIVHIFLPTEREFYDLEAFWGHSPKIFIDDLMF